MAVFGLTIGLSSGFSVITGQRFGAEDMDGVRRSVATSAMLALVITLMLTACVSLAMLLIMRLMNISDVLYDDAYHYMLIVVLGLVAMMSYNLRPASAGPSASSRTPLYFLIVSSLLNIALALLFIVAFGWGVPGSAIALVIAQAVSAVLCLCFMRRRFPMLRLTRATATSTGPLPGSICAWACPWPSSSLSFPWASWSCSRSAIPLALKRLPASYRRLKIEQLALQPMISFGIAMAVYSAQNYGASQYGRIRQGVRQCSLVSLVFCLAAAVAMYSYGQELISVFTTDHDEVLRGTGFPLSEDVRPVLSLPGPDLRLPQRIAGHGHFQRAPHQQHPGTGRPQCIGPGPGRHVGLLRHLLCQPYLLGPGLLIYRRFLFLGHAHHEGQRPLRRLSHEGFCHHVRFLSLYSL